MSTRILLIRIAVIAVGIFGFIAFLIGFGDAIKCDKPPEPTVLELEQ